MDVFYCIGNFNEIPYAIKSPPGRIALRRKGNMSQKRPAAGGGAVALSDSPFLQKE